jgi:GNAT superfamily N-acetyltransferase
MQIVQATPADCDTSIAIMEEAAGWLAARGINQWQGGAPAEQILRRIERGETYVAIRNDEVVGTITLQWSDRHYWGEMPDDAGYVHGLAIRRAVAGHGVGRDLLRWAERQIANAGKRFMRLDCVADNHTLCEYYKQAGLAPHSTKHFTHSSAQLFEKQVAKALDSGASGHDEHT